MYLITHNDQNQSHLQNGQDSQKRPLMLTLRLRPLQPVSSTTQEQSATQAQPPQQAQIPPQPLALQQQVTVLQNLLRLRAILDTHPTMSQNQSLQLVQPVPLRPPALPQYKWVQRKFPQVQTTNPEQPQNTEPQSTGPQSAEPQSTLPKSTKPKPTRIKLVDQKKITKKKTITSITGAIKAIKYRKFTKPKFEKEGAFFTCSICGLKIKKRSNLKQHEQTHNPNLEKKHGCNHCNYKCHRKHDVVRHEAGCHGKSNSGQKTVQKRKTKKSGTIKRLGITKVHSRSTLQHKLV